ncbi:MAG TPA: methionine adenosyltransferase [Gemmatimonadota bacterium]
MNRERHLFTSESVTEGHPDKIADQISDAVLDAILAQDPRGRVACEALVTTGMAFVAGEITTNCYVDIPDIVRETVRQIGYTDPSYGFDWQTCAVLTTIGRQSRDIAQGVDTGGAGDQGMMFGYATNETPERMPLPILLAHRLVRSLAEARRQGRLPFLRPDGKSQVTVEYAEGRPVRIDGVVLSAQHDEEIGREELVEALKREIIFPSLPRDLVDPARLTCHVNPTGRFVTGGPHGDTGLTGRKCIVDTYGGVGSHGGGAFSGKDPTKVDRSASYAARYVAKNVVEAGLAEHCEVQLAYAIGVAEPVSLMIDLGDVTNGTEAGVVDAVRRLVDLRPLAIIERLDLRRPIYKRTAAYGHFGRNEEGFTWERTDLAEDLKRTLA